jgi:hypothetical protein
MGQPIDSHPATQPHKAALTGAVLSSRLSAESKDLKVASPSSGRAHKR